MTNNLLGRKAAKWTTLLIAAALSSCSLMHDDLEPCPMGVDVAIKFDYNIERTNLFGPEIGGITVYAFDMDGRFVTEKEESGKALTTNDYIMHLDLQPGDYQLLAVGGVESYESILSKPGAKFRRPKLKQGDTMESLHVILDRENGVVEQQGVSLDDHFQSIVPVNVSIRDMEYAKAEIPVMRITNNLRVNLFRTDFPAYTNPADLDIYIVDRNGHINYDNSLIDDEEIIYKPYSTSTDVRDDGYGIAVADLSFARLMAASDNPAKLTINDALTGATNSIDLAPLLVEFRHAEAFAQWNYSEQEFLDRQNLYEIDVPLTDGIVKWVVLRIPVLNWAKRIQLVEF